MLEVLRKAPISIEPCECPFDDPASWEHDKTLLIGDFGNDLDVDAGGVDYSLAVVRGIGKGNFNARMAPPGLSQERNGAIPVPRLRGGRH